MSEAVVLPNSDPFGVDLDRLRSLDGVKWSRYANHDADVIPAWVADMDLAPAPMAIEAMQRVLDRGDLGYNLAASKALPEAFAKWQIDSHGWELDPEEVMLFNDVLHGIEYTIWHWTEPGDGVVLQTPIYPPFIKAVESTGRRIVGCPLDSDGWRFDVNRLREVIDDNTKVILMCNPHNPTGRVFDEAELRAMAEVVVEHDLLLISDEVWGDLLHPGTTHLPAAMVSPELAQRTVTLSSASKSFNLAGMRCAEAHLGHPELRRQFQNHSMHLRGAVNTLGAEATLACWTEGRAYLDTVRAHLTAQRDHLHRRLGEELPEVGFQLPEATYLAWLDFRAYQLGPNPSKELLGRAAVAMSPGPDFGSLGDGFARLNLATSRGLLDEIVDRLVQALTA